MAASITDTNETSDHGKVVESDETTELLDAVKLAASGGPTAVAAAEAAARWAARAQAEAPAAAEAAANMPSVDEVLESIMTLEVSSRFESNARDGATGQALGPGEDQKALSEQLEQLRALKATAATPFVSATVEVVALDEPTSSEERTRAVAARLLDLTAAKAGARRVLSIEGPQDGPSFFDGDDEVGVENLLGSV